MIAITCTQTVSVFVTRESQSGRLRGRDNGNHGYIGLNGARGAPARWVSLFLGKSSTGSWQLSFQTSPTTKGFEHCPRKHHSLTKLKKHCVILKIQYVPLTDFLSKLILFKKSLFWKLFWEYKRITWVLTESIHRRQEISIVHLSRPEISSSLTRSQQSTGTHLWVFLLTYTCVHNILKQKCKMLHV